MNTLPRSTPPPQLAALFAWLYDQLLPHTQTIVSTGEYGIRDPRYSAWISVLRIRSTPVAPEDMLAAVTHGDWRTWLCAAAAIDHALGLVHPRVSAPGAGGGLKHFQSQFLLRGWLHQDDLGLVVFDRLDREPSSPGVTPVAVSGDRLDSRFKSLRRIAAFGAPWRLDFQVLKRRDDPPRKQRPWRVGVAPLAQDHADVCWKYACQGEEHRVDVRPDDPARLVERLIRVTRAMGAADVDIAVFPELVVPREAIAALAAADIQCPRIVVAGTGLSTEVADVSGLPFNECAVLGPRGQDLWRQRKLNHYAMGQGQVERYALRDVVPDGVEAGYSLNEHTQSGTTVVVRDSRELGRMVVLICEDLAQNQPRDVLFDSVRPRWVFSPVLDGALAVSRDGALHGRWTSHRAWDLADQGATVVVATSMVLERRVRPTGELVVGVVFSGEVPGRANLLVVDGVSDLWASISMDTASDGWGWTAIHLPQRT